MGEVSDGRSADCKSAAFMRRRFDSYLSHVSYNAEQMRQYMTNYRSTLREEFIDLLGGQCVQCSSTTDLEFDHIDPKTKLFNISGFHKSREALLAELKKCQLLCSECHKAKTQALPRTLKGCGSVSSYRRGCRCAACKHEMLEARHRWNLKYRGRV